MADDLNLAIVEGYLARDAEPIKGRLREGKFFVTFILASNRHWTDRNGKQKRMASWINCSLFGDRAPKLLEFLTKGRKLRIQGPIKTRFWTSRHSEYRQKNTYIEVDKIDFLGGKVANDGNVADLEAVEPTNTAPAVDEYGGPGNTEF